MISFDIAHLKNRVGLFKIVFNVSLSNQEKEQRTKQLKSTKLEPRLDIPDHCRIYESQMVRTLWRKYLFDRLI